MSFYEIINDDYTNVIEHVLQAAEARCLTPVVVTDPPFNINFKYDTYKDNKNDSEYILGLHNLISVFNNVVFIAYPEILYKLSALTGVIPIKVCCWVYNSNNPRQHRDIAFYGINPDFKKHGQPYKNPNDKRVKKLIAAGKHARLYDWWNVNQVKNVSREKTKHPCQMPLEVMKNIIGTLPDNILVFDPFNGSGTTGIACAHFQVDFIGCDIDKEYCDIALERYENGFL